MFFIQRVILLTGLSSEIITTSAFLSSRIACSATSKLNLNWIHKQTTAHITRPSFSLEEKQSIDYDDIQYNEVESDDVEARGSGVSDSKTENNMRSNKIVNEELSETYTCRGDADLTPTSSQSFVMQPIGQVSSVYRLCVGTPRQGLLAPNSRGRIDLYPNRISADSVIDLEKFSHVWVVFIFHLNSNTHVVNRSSEEETPRQFPAKIAPPALGGKRVGVFSTRSPHRPNPVGFSLCKIDSVIIPNRKKKKRLKGSEIEPYCINISGLDLVDGTPVLDIKPYVPHYDSVGYNEGGGYDVENAKDEVRLPPWVREGLNKRRPVKFTLMAEKALESIMKSDGVHGMEFFGVASGRDKSIDSGLASVKSCIIEVLGVDVRSAWQTGKARTGKSQAEKSIRVKQVLKDNVARVVDNEEGQIDSSVCNPKMCTQQLDNLLIKYTIDLVDNEKTKSSVNTDGSGADDMVTVRDTDLI